MSRRWLWIAAWAIATGLVVVLARNVDATRFTRALESADWRWLLAAAVANLAIQPFGAMQWRSLLPTGIELGRKRVTELFMLTSVANNTTPSIIGHAVGALLLAAEPMIGRASALSVLALDQACVGIAKITVLLIATAVAPMPEWMRAGFAGLAGAVALLIIYVAVAARHHRRFAAWAETANLGRAGRLVRALVRWSNGLDALRSPRRFARGVGFALLVKTAEGTGIFCVQLAFGVAPSFASVVLVLAATSLSSVVPIAPANIGTYEAATYAAYRSLGLAPEIALGIAIVQHACLLLPSVLPGYLILVRRPRSFSPAEAEP